jgi:cytochrome c-type biogenesis protein CcmH
MTGFFIGAGILMAMALLVLLYPLLRRDAGETSMARGKINARVYRDQLAELEIDRANGIIDPAAYEQSRRELERRALADIDEAGEADTSNSETSKDGAPAMRATRWPAIVLVLVIPFAAILTYVMLGKPAAMIERVDEHAVTVEKIHRMVADLAKRLETHPEDLKGWVMLGRAYKAMDRLPEAIQAFEKAGAALDEDPQNLIDFAEALARNDKENFAKRGAPLIARALKIDPDHIPALVFAGSEAFERGDYRAASRHWNKVLLRVPPDSDEAQALTEAISRADAASGQNKGAAKSTAKSNDKSSAAAGVSGVVSLAPALAGKAGPEDTVFVFARAAEGPRAPLAVFRARVRDLPLKFSLDDTQAMAPELRLSKFAKIRVEARISKSGNAAPLSGDLQGSSDIVANSARDLRVVIDKPVP